MALINCPECDTIVSDKAIQCPRCAYPISQLHTQTGAIKQNPISQAAKSNVENITVNVQHPAYNNLALPNKKSEALGFLFPFLFGPLGLLYANTKKGINLFLLACGINFLIVITMYDSGSMFALLLISYLVIWIISIVTSVKTVTRYNEALMQQANAQMLPKTATSNDTDTLWQMIQKEKSKSVLDQSQRPDILRIVEKNCTTRETALVFLNDYADRYNKDLIEELKSISTAYKNIEENLSVFIEHNIVSDKFPHERI